MSDYNEEALEEAQNRMYDLKGRFYKAKERGNLNESLYNEVEEIWALLLKVPESEVEELEGRK